MWRVSGGNETPLGEVPSWTEAQSRDITTPGERPGVVISES